MGGPDYLLSGRATRAGGSDRTLRKILLLKSNRVISEPMPKRQIINLPGQRHFVTFSTYQLRRFFDSAHTRDIVMEVLDQSLGTHRAGCSGFVIMPSHVHAILFGEPDFQISRLIQAWKKTSSYRLKRLYASEVTSYHQMCPQNCPIWQAGFYDFNLESDEKISEKLDYMHNNPVQAQLADTHVAWPWSSARFYEFGERVGVTITE
jgi:putative transposase